MNKEGIVKVVKEKGPTFLVGAIVGAAVLAAFLNREGIAKTVNRALGRDQQSVTER